MRALVVDDSRAMRAILRQLLHSTGFEVVEAAHGKDALKRLEENSDVAVALVDWNMPEMNGYEFVCAVRADQRYAAMRIMMVTTESDIGQVGKALEAGANEYLMKPFTKESVIEKLQIMGVTP